MSLLAVQALIARNRPVRTPALRMRISRLHRILIALVTIIALSFPSELPIWVVADAATSGEYPGYKLTRLILISAPTVCAAVLAYSYVPYAGFQKGAIRGAFLVGVFAAWQLSIHWGRLTSTQWSSFHQAARFSTLSVSLIALFVLLAAGSLALKRAHWILFPVFLGVASMCLMVIFFLAQRTAFFLGLFFVLVFFLGMERRKRRNVGTLFAVFLFTVLMIAAAQPLVQGTFLERISEYPAQWYRFAVLGTSDDLSTSIRFQVMWPHAFWNGLAKPLGHGFGGFAQDFPDLLYPHNVLLEVLFELGILGFVLVSALVVRTVLVAWRLYRMQGREMYCFGLLAVFVYAMKAGDISNAGEWIFWIYLASAAHYGGETARTEGALEDAVQSERRQVSPRTPQSHVEPLHDPLPASNRAISSALQRTT